MGDRRSGRRVGLIVLLAWIEGLVEGAAWLDLARRPPAAVRGRKWWWAMAINVHFIGPFCYLRWGRIPEADRTA